MSKKEAVALMYTLIIIFVFTYFTIFQVIESAKLNSIINSELNEACINCLNVCEYNGLEVLKE